MEDNGNITITPYNCDLTAKRYTEMKKTLHGGLFETGSTYRLVISVSKAIGTRRAAEIMLDEATTASEYLYEMYNPNNE